MNRTFRTCTDGRLFMERLEDRNLLSVTSLDNLTVDPTSFDDDSIIVSLRPDVGFASISAVDPAIAQAGSFRYLGNHLYSVQLSEGVTVQQALEYFQSLPQVNYAQPDYVVSLTRTPNDPSFSSQWGMNNTGQNGGTRDADSDVAEAWDVTTGSGRTIVAVIDTGVDYNHPDLAGNIWRNTREIPGNGIDDDRNGFIDDIRGWDFANNDNDPMDDNGHGTHVAGIIGAIGNNGIGVAGVNWDVQIMPLKFLGANGTGSLSDAIRALNYAVANGATISNNSYGGGGFYQAFYDAVAAAGRAGHIFVAAAGNSSQNTDSYPAYPASYNLDNIISVAATDRNDQLASFSNYGARNVDIAAPGVSIYSTLNNNRYGTMSGTSMAAPFVAGAVALVRDLHPDWTYRQVINQVLNTGDSIAALQGKTVTGKRLNIARAVGANTNPLPTPPTPPTTPSDTKGASVVSASFHGDTAGTLNRVRVTFSEAINVGSFTGADVVSLTRNGTTVSGVTYTVTPVSGTNNQFDIRFTTQSAVGTYALTIGPDIRDLAGNPMNQNGNSVNGEVADRYTATASLMAPTNSTFYSADPPKTIADLSRVTSTLTIGQNITIDQLSVKININHTYVKDLRITLTSPDGKSLVLFDRRGGSADNINTVLDDRARTPVSQGTAPFLGWHKPENALAAFAGKNARGTWTLTVEDVALYDTGRLNSWSLTIESGGGISASSIRSDDVQPSESSGILLGASLETAPVTSTVQSPTPRPTPVANFARDIDPGVRRDRQEIESPEVILTYDSTMRLDIGEIVERRGR